MRLSVHSPRRRDRRFPPPPRQGHRHPPALEWAQEAAGKCARVTSIGSHGLLVENHRGLLSFTQQRVVVDTPQGPLCVLGSGLSLRDARPEALIIHGVLRQVELPCEGGDRPDEG